MRWLCCGNSACRSSGWFYSPWWAEYCTLHLPVEHGSFLAGRTVGDLQTGHHLDIVLVERNGDVNVQPSRELTLEVGDDLVLFAQQERVLDLVSPNVTG